MKKSELKELVKQELQSYVTEGKRTADAGTLRFVHVAAKKKIFGHSRESASSLLNDHRLTHSYRALGHIEELMGIPPELPKLQNKLDKILKKNLQKQYENWEEIWENL
jgi:hypothetical protein